mmetsp:Transcript_106561/g.333323  ORF Transcript_106561/g.333323 Transcript_106561/m.333323 type:complete len:287 (+) Transcript_106561:719-1579(+)
MVHLIRIQKTGGTTFGEKIMPQFCGHEGRYCQYLMHKDWSMANADAGGRDFLGHLVVLLRHPVERAMSEFLFLRNIDGFICAGQDQWDFRNSEWLHFVQHEPSTEKALYAYLNEPFNPSRNRQAMYLIGFDRSPTSVPGMAFDWDNNRTALLELAKEHLRQTIFGITDCFGESLRAISDAIGWNTTQVMQMAAVTKARHTASWAMEYQVQNLTHSFVPEVLNETFSLYRSPLWPHDRPQGSWRALLQDKLVTYLENWNSVDMELYEYALDLFAERYHEDCRKDIRS